MPCLEMMCRPNINNNNNNNKRLYSKIKMSYLETIMKIIITIIEIFKVFKYMW